MGDQHGTAQAVWTDEDRLAALHRYQILDTPKEDDFDDIVNLARQFCNAPVSLISFVDKDRQWFKAHAGVDMRETPLDVSFCKYSISHDEIMVVPDATKDVRFADNALVFGDPNIRFYAGAVLRTPDGFPLGTMCIVDFKPREITGQEEETLKALSRQVMTLLELKRALREKKKSEERLQFALDTSAIVGTWDFDLRKNIIFADARFCRLFSIDPEEGEKGAPAAMFNAAIHPDDLNRVSEKVRIAIETGSEYAEEYRVINGDKEVRWVFARGRAYHDENGEPLRFPGAAVDITDRKRYERKQAARVELNDSLLNIKRTADVTLIAAEIIGNALDGVRAGYGELSEDGRFITIERDWTNGRVASIAGVHEFKNYGVEFSEAIKRGEVIVIDDVYKDHRMAEGLERLDKLQIRSLINIALIEDGKPRALFFIHDTKPRHWREGEIELVTEMALRTWAEVERVHAEELMVIALEKAEAASVAKTEFLANMSHEIRTPMNAIVGLSNILSNERLTPRQQEFVRTLHMSAESLLTLINDLLDISKIEARTVDLEKIPFDLALVVQEVISIMSMKAIEKGLNFKMDVDGVKGRYFVGDPARLRQIILNLCGNAIKFTESGSIDIQVTILRTDADGTSEICIAIKDTGIGIPENKIDTIFEKFVQADTSINRKYGGTGLGLAITKMLVGIMGGTITVESKLGEGSTFTVCLPLPLSQEHPSIPTENRETSADQLNTNFKKRILLVEDYAPNVLVAGTFLEEFGFEWDSAKSGHEAVEKAFTQEYAAILMDVQMFGMNGFEATKAIREREKNDNRKAVPIIGMTAHALAGDREKCLSVGMDDYISKPFNPDDLQDKLQTLTGLNR